MSRIADIQAKIDELEAYMKSGTYADFIRGTQEQVGGCEQSILYRVPNSFEELAAVLQLHGQMSALRSDLTVFEERLDSLKKLLDKEIENSNHVVKTTKE